MHILGIVIAVLGGAALWYWRFRMLRDAGRDVVDALGRVRGAHRMRRFRQQAESSPLAAVDDPALAAAIFLFALAGERAPGTEPATDLVRFELADAVPDERMDETIAYAEWAARNVADPRDCIRRFTDLWRRALSVDERNDLLDMAQNIAGPTPAHHQRLTLEALRSAITYQ